MHTPAFGTNFKQAVVGGGERDKMSPGTRLRRRKHDALSDRPLQRASDLHVDAEFLWTRTHR